MLMLMTVCAWCKRTIKSGEGVGPISHGICDDCLVSALEELKNEAEAVAALDDLWVDYGGEG